MIKWLTEDLRFPDIEEASPDGLLAVGGNLLPDRLLLAYRQGIYPCYSEEEPILWWSPDPRGVIPIDGLHIGKTLSKFIRREVYEVRINTAFEEVMIKCALRNEKNSSRWITDEMLAAYKNLHIMGYAHSVEMWQGAELVGGLYGIAIGGMFAGESMFYRAPNASKMALVALSEHLKKQGFSLLDCQMVTDATKAMGGLEISRSEYLKRLDYALSLKCSFL